MIKYILPALLSISWACGSAQAPAREVRGESGPVACTAIETKELGTHDLSAELSIQPVDEETLVAWKTGLSAVRLAHATAGGEVRTDELFLSDSARPMATAPSAAWSGDGYLVGWLEEASSGAVSFFARRFTPTLTPVGEIIPIVEDEIVGRVLLGYVGERFVALWASGQGAGLLRHATIDPHTASTMKRIVGAGAGPFVELAAEPYATGLLVSWRGGRVIVEADGSVRGRPSETGVRERDPRPPTWTQNPPPELPEVAQAIGRGFARGDRLFVPWVEDGVVFCGAFGPDGRPAGGPWEVARTDPGPGATQVGIGPIGADLAVIYLSRGGTTVSLARFAPCD